MNARISAPASLFLFMTCAVYTAWASDLSSLQMTKKDIPLWQEKTFKGHTDYKFTETGNLLTLSAHCDGTASALYKYMKVDLAKTPMLRWSWKIEDIHAGLDDVSKAGDDYAARVYVIYKGKMPWDVKAVNYVWANAMKEGRSWPNAFTAKSIMVAQRSGSPEDKNTWVEESRDIRADFIQYFGMDISRLDGIAIMTDCDNGGGTAAGHYRDIRFTPR